MGFLRQLRRADLPVPPMIDQQSVREEMRRDDPEFDRISRAQHEALQVVTAQRIKDGIALRHEREFWTRHHPT